VEAQPTTEEPTPMPHPATARAQRPQDLLPIIQDAINRTDIDAFLAAHDDGAVVVVPPDGRPARGRDEIRAAMTPVLAMQPHLETAVVQTLVGDGFALSHSRWHLVLSENGSRSELRGLGTMVSRRTEDGTWRIVLDNPLTAPDQQPVAPEAGRSRPASGRSRPMSGLSRPTSRPAAGRERDLGRGAA
jgi:uncharacterized protein (TIGR02246 family)